MESKQSVILSKLFKKFGRENCTCNKLFLSGMVSVGEILFLTKIHCFPRHSYHYKQPLGFLVFVNNGHSCTSGKNFRTYLQTGERVNKEKIASTKTH